MNQLEKLTLDLPTDLLEKYQDQPLDERMPLIMKLLATTCAGVPYFCVLVGDNGDHHLLGNLAPEALEAVLDGALEAVREQVRARAN